MEYEFWRKRHPDSARLYFGVKHFQGIIGRTHYFTASYQYTSHRNAARLIIYITQGTKQHEASLKANKAMIHQSIGYVALVVKDYDEAIAFYVGVLGFTLVEDTFIAAQSKRWVVVAPPGATESRVLLARAVGEEQTTRIGNQTGGRVFLFLQTNDIWRDFDAYQHKGVVFVRPPNEESYGTVAVFQDLYGNLWDLIQSKP